MVMVRHYDITPTPCQTRGQLKVPNVLCTTCYSVFVSSGLQSCLRFREAAIDLEAITLASWKCFCWADVWKFVRFINGAAGSCGKDGVMVMEMCVDGVVKV